MSKGKGFIIGATVASVLMMGVGVGLERSADLAAMDQYNDVAGHENSADTTNGDVTALDNSTAENVDASKEVSVASNQASEEASAEENAIERMEFSEYGFYPLRSEGDTDDYMVWKDNKYAATFHTRYTFLDQVESFKDKKIDRLESGLEGYLVSTEGKNYMINVFSDGFYELEEGSMYPELQGHDVTYIMPSNADKTMGDLYYMYCVYKIPKLIAHNVVGASNGIVDDNGDFYDFVYQKYENGKYSLVRARVNEEALEEKEGDYEVEETVLLDGNYMPLSYDGGLDFYSMYYLDVDNKAFYYTSTKENETKKIYTGEYDKYYIGGGVITIVSGKDVYYYSAGLGVDVAVPILHTGLSEYYTGGYCSPVGYLGGYRMEGDGIFIDDDRKEYSLRFQGSEGNPVIAYELPHKLEERGTELYSGTYLTYIEDGVLYVDDLTGYEIRTYIKFDQEPVYSTCSNYNGDYFFVFTTEGNIYYIDSKDKQVTKIDSGIDFIEETQDYNYAWDCKWYDLVYSKNGKYYYFDVFQDQVGDGFDEDVEGYFVHDGDYTYFQYPDEDTPRLYMGHNFYPFY